MRTDKEWMREDTWHFEVEVLRIYGRQELWSHGFGARPVSDGPYQPVDAADVRRRVAFGARQDNEFAVRHCCVHRSRWSVVSGARVPRGTSKPLATTSSASEREEAVRPHKSKFPRRSFSRERSPTSTGGPRACYRRRGKLSDGGSPLAAPAPSLPLPAGGATGRAVPLIDRVSEGVFWRKAPGHALRQGTGLQQDQHPQGPGPTTPAGTTPPSSPTYDSHRLHLPNSTDGSRILNPATS
ncbi:hypothetical protein THAOC_31962 [Thalassiosira oceanica]|uniref:DUF6743 domain-containing protein n=1 Tax=Thalassiosira oceanica TaxID=159749 RepID=K0RK30_THAOC|nr:hypothetical protein THAOC_31962 [Thalassiosira oceanica]|eukprot:EJK49191.1 hypothetical protein THAOC_31962 [Thalassiosira oceanica]